MSRASGFTLAVRPDEWFCLVGSKASRNPTRASAFIGCSRRLPARRAAVNVPSGDRANSTQSSGQAISLFCNLLKQPTILRRVQLTGLGDAVTAQNPVKRTAPEPIIIVDAQPLSHDRAGFAMTRHTNHFCHEWSIARPRCHNCCGADNAFRHGRAPPRRLTGYPESARCDFIRCKRRQRSRDDASVKQAIQQRPSNSNRDPVM
jgi:hypothetical protein